MEDKINKVFEENPELAKAAEHLAVRVLPHIVEALILGEKLDKSRLNDSEYVWQILMQNLDIIDNLQHSFRIDDELMKSARDAAQQQRITVMVILVATAIEHLLNMFYRDALGKLYGLSDKETIEAIRSNTHAKLGWLLKIVTDKRISDDLEKRIRQIVELRNGFVHYKSVAVSINEKDKIQEMIDEAKKIGIESILNTPAELEGELSIIGADIFPELEMAKKAVEKMGKSKPKQSS